MRNVPSWHRIAVPAPTCNQRPRIRRPRPRLAYSSTPRSRNTKPRVTTCGFAILNRKNLQYRTRYHGVYARCRTAQRSEATVTSRALRGSRRRGTRPSEQAVVPTAQRARRREHLDRADQLAGRRVAPARTEAVDAVRAGAVDVVRPIAEHQHLVRRQRAEPAQCLGDHLRLRVA